MNLLFHKIISRLILPIILLTIAQTAFSEYAGKLINTHAQYDEQVTLKEVVNILKSAGVTKILISGRGKVTNKDLIVGARRYFGFVYPVIRTKTEAYRQQQQNKWRKYVNKTSRTGKFYGFQELLLYHAAKKSKKGEKLAPEVSVSINDPRIKTVIDAAQRNGWPIPLHYEFRSVGKDRRLELINQLEKILKQYPGQAFTLMHMGQLDIDEVRSLLKRHKNIYFQLSMTANVYRRSNYPWTYMFVKSDRLGVLQPKWKNTLEKYPERFLLAFDGVLSWVWRRDLSRDVDEWRAALDTLPPPVADLIAYRNAERLWPELR
jgi:hypothetical protein